MITFDNNKENRLGTLLDSDGKIKISDDMPEDLKAAISYLNANNIGLFDPVSPLADEDLNIDSELEVEEDVNVDEEDSEEEISEDEDEASDSIVEEDVDIGDLEELF